MGDLPGHPDAKSRAGSVLRPGLSAFLLRSEPWEGQGLGSGRVLHPRGRDGWLQGQVPQQSLPVRYFPGKGTLVATGVLGVFTGRPQEEGSASDLGH